MLCSKNTKINVCLLKVLQSSVWGGGGESLRNYSSFKWKFCGLGVCLLVLFCNFPSKQSCLSICLICWKTVVAVFYSKKPSLLCLKHKHLQVSVEAMILLLWCFGEFMGFVFFLSWNCFFIYCCSLWNKLYTIWLWTPETMESRSFNACLMLIFKWEHLKENLFRINSSAGMSLMEWNFSRGWTDIFWYWILTLVKAGREHRK